MTDDEPRLAVRRNGHFLRTLSAVAWSFFGVRRSSDHERDASGLDPLHVVIAGVLGAVLFVVLLLLFVSGVVDSGVAR